MANFCLGNLSQWRPVDVNEILPIPGTGEEPRLVRFFLMSSDPVSVFVTDEAGDRRLVASGSGKLRVSFTAVGDLDFEVTGDPDSEVFICRRSEPQVVDHPDQVSFTTIEPRGVRESSDMKRMMYAMRLNMERREGLLRDELVRMRELVPAPVDPSARPLRGSPVPEPASAPAHDADPS